MNNESQHSPDPSSEPQPSLEPWMVDLAREIGDEEVDVPRELMWKRIQQRRAAATVPETVGRGGVGLTSGPIHRVRWRGIAAIAAVLVGGIAIGRYAMPWKTATPAVNTAANTAVNTAAQISDSMATPARVAMSEHLVRSVALLTTVRDRDPKQGPAPDVSSWARDLLGTTRLLLDEPSLRDDRTRRLLQDLELVLMQIIQSRGTAAPEAQRAPTETMRETNLLPRVRAVVSASAHREALTVHGADE